jgi:hypothetical protein
MKLEQAQAAFRDGPNNKIRRGIDKHADAHDSLRRFFENSGHGWNRHVSRAVVVKNKAQCVRSRLNGGLRVGGIRDSANFDLNAHLNFSCVFLIAATFTGDRFNRKSYIVNCNLRLSSRVHSFVLIFSGHNPEINHELLVNET